MKLGKFQIFDHLENDLNQSVESQYRGRDANGRVLPTLCIWISLASYKYLQKLKVRRALKNISICIHQYLPVKAHNKKLYACSYSRDSNFNLGGDSIWTWVSVSNCYDSVSFWYFFRQSISCLVVQITWHWVQIANIKIMNGLICWWPFRVFFTFVVSCISAISLKHIYFWFQI